MLAILVKIIGVFTSEIAKKLAEKISISKTDICSDLFRLYIALEELLQQATVTYQLFEEFVEYFNQLKDNDDFKLTMRYEARELLDCLKRYEKLLRKIFIKLKLIDDEGISIRLAKVPESSYTLFKRFFVEDLAPKFIADRTSNKYVLRLTVKKSKHEIVKFNKLGHISIDLEKLFNEGYLAYEIIEIGNKEMLADVLVECSNDLLALKNATEALRALIKSNCDLQKILS